MNKPLIPFNPEKKAQTIFSTRDGIILHAPEYFNNTMANIKRIEAAKKYGSHMSLFPTDQRFKYMNETPVLTMPDSLKDELRPQFMSEPVLPPAPRETLLDGEPTIDPELFKRMQAEKSMAPDVTTADQPLNESLSDAVIPTSQEADRIQLLRERANNSAASTDDSNQHITRMAA